jgi:hypothetical protein
MFTDKNRATLTVLLVAIFCIYISPSTASSNETCDIFIPGYNAEKYETTRDYFGPWNRHVYWNTKQEIPDAAEEMASKIWDVIQNDCLADEPVVLRAHSYGVAVIAYILGKGHRYVEQFPEHKFVKIYRRVFAIYSYTGAFRGTPIMDLLCSNGFIGKVAAVFSQKCVLSLSSATNHHPFHYISSVGVPIHLIYSSDRSAFGGIPGLIMAISGVGWNRFFIDGLRNQNDSVLPTYSTRGCGSNNPLFGADANCSKLDPDYMLDFFWLDTTSHNDFLDDPAIMWMKYEEPATP